MEGSFTVLKMKKVFSTISIDQAHEQNNAHIIGDGGAVGLTDNSSALPHWMIAGPEVASAIAEFQAGDEHWEKQVDACHHGKYPSVQTIVTKDVYSPVRVIEELCNLFEEGGYGSGCP